MTPIRRDFRFHLSARNACNWHARGRHVTHFFNALSIFFPVGERFFINSIRNYREQLTDAALKQAVLAFIGQEAMHGREHEDYNRMLVEGGLPAETLEQLVTRMFAAFRKFTPDAWQLSMTIAIEHFTACLSDALLEQPDAIEGSDPRFTALWRWHALEETEHKAVCFDVWNEVMGDGLGAHLIRTGGMAFTTALFVTLVTVFTITFIETDPDARRQASGYRSLFGFLLREPGVLRHGFPLWRAYFSRSFHPWQHENQHLLAQLAGVAGQVRAFSLPEAA